MLIHSLGFVRSVLKMVLYVSKVLFPLHLLLAHCLRFSERFCGCLGEPEPEFLEPQPVLVGRFLHQLAPETRLPGEMADNRR